MYIEVIGSQETLSETQYSSNSLTISSRGIKEQDPNAGWWRGTVVERRSLTGELSLSCARPAADG